MRKLAEIFWILAVALVFSLAFFLIGLIICASLFHQFIQTDGIMIGTRVRLLGDGYTRTLKLPLGARGTVVRRDKDGSALPFLVRWDDWNTAEFKDYECWTSRDMFAVDETGPPALGIETKRIDTLESNVGALIRIQDEALDIQRSVIKRIDALEESIQSPAVPSITPWHTPQPWYYYPPTIPIPIPTLDPWYYYQPLPIIPEYAMPTPEDEETTDSVFSNDLTTTCILANFCTATPYTTTICDPSEKTLKRIEANQEAILRLLESSTTKPQ